jgi:thiamine pyrophosphate-dependent acetolactate synthase large subunit-like protein
MGGAALTGLGLAIAQPSRPVVVFTGDGEQLMGLGGLATIAVRAPKNLSIVVLDNGHYGETGGQLSHSGAGVDLAKVAQAMGIPKILDVRDQDGLATARKALHAIDEGPRVVVLRIDHEQTLRALPSRDGALLKLRMRAHLGLSGC